MIALGSVRWTDKNPNITLTFEYEKQRSGANMQYRAKITVSTVTGSSYFGYPIYLKLSLGGELRETVTLKSANPSRWSDVITHTSAWYTISNKTTGTVPVSFNVYSGSGATRSGTYAYNMAVDPAASEIRAEDGTLGVPLTLNVTRYNTSFTDTITYTCGTTTGQVVAGSTAASVTWNLVNGNTLLLASQNTKGLFVDVTFTVTTYSGGTVVGTNSKTVEMAIPESVAPSVSLKVEDAAGYFATYGAYVQGFSKLKITATPTLAYGSPITTYAVTADGASYATGSVITPAIRGKNALSVTAKVTDARTRSGEATPVSINVLEYAKPAVTLSAYRCDSKGVADAEGAYMKIVLVATISELNGKNSASYTISYPSNSGTTLTITGTGTSYASGAIACDAAATRLVSVTVSDRLSSTSQTATVPIAYTLMDYHSSGKGVAFGKVATRDGFDCAMDAYFTGDVSVGGKLLIDLIYPVGSIYMSTNNVSPQTFFEGTWERIQDRFLLAAGSTYSAGGTGGEATHTLTIDEMPYHGHVMKVATATSTASDAALRASGVKAYSSQITNSPLDNIVEAGGNVAHNNMPPYLVVYMWKRTL